MSSPDWMVLPRTWFEPGVALRVIQTCFQAGEAELRIASGFFTIRGWGLIRRHTLGKHVYLLVGLDDPGEDRALKVLIDEILLNLRTGLDGDRRQAVMDLVARMEAGQFQILDARALNHHAKIYLVDYKFAIIGSSNTTGRGLLEQIESGSLITDLTEVSHLIENFDGYFALAKDLTQELLEVLQRWLQLATPWDIYLKTMLALEDLQPIKAVYKKQPVSYQVDMISQTLRQIRSCGGSMLVASTGLGKTVVAVHVALHLRDEDIIDNVMVIGPKVVKRNWERELLSASLPHRYFTRQILDMKNASQARLLEEFEEISEDIQEKRWLLIIDESHELRNRYPGRLDNWGPKRTERRAFQRLRTLIERGNPKVLLLSGSPYAKDADNINNQLFLLPHTDENRSLLSEVEFADRAWKIDDTSDFIQLPVASQLTTPHVSRYYAQTDEQGNYILYGDEKRYIPNVQLHSIEFPLDGEHDLAPAIAKGYFHLKSCKRIFRDNIERLVKIAWASSPLATRSILKHVLDTPGGPNAFKFSQKEQSEFKYSLEERQRVLSPIWLRLSNATYESDIKLQVLVRILLQHHTSGEKIIIFCERRATVAYLAEALKQLIPVLQIAATVNEDKPDSFGIKEQKEIEELIKRFAPRANDAEGMYEERYDVFLSTDAFGIGVNMQDASVVVNYDIDWTPINPIQRAGRILRFYHQPRTVQIYTFVPILNYKDQRLQIDLASIRKRWEKLITRHEESRKLVDLPVLTANHTQNLSMPELASQVTIRSGELNLADLADLDISPYYQHTAQLQQHRKHANSLPSDMISAKTYAESSATIYVLLKYQEQYHGLIYEPKTGYLREPNPVKLLDLISCTPNTPIAAVDVNLIDSLAETCIRAWCDREGINSNDVVRECTLYLKPLQELDEIEHLLDTSC